MSITLEEFQNKKPHLRYDPERRKYIGYRIDVQSGGKRYRNTFRTKGEAERFVETLRTKNVYRRAGLKFTADVDVPLKDLFEKRLSQIKDEKGHIRAKRIFEAFDATFDAPAKVLEVRSSHIQQYINDRLETGVTPQTVDREVTEISSALHQASALFPTDLEDYEPPKIPRPKYKKRKKKKRVITASEKDAIVKAILTTKLSKERAERRESRRAAAWIFEVAWLMGFRFSEVTGLRKDKFSLGSRSIGVMRWKTGEFVTINYLPDRVIEILEAACKVSDTELIFNLNCSEHTFTAIIKDACVASGVPYGRSLVGGVTFHSTRHSFTSRLVQVTDIATAGEFTGHSSGEMVDYYSQPSEESKRLAMERMYGSANRDEKLTEIYEKVRSGEIDLETFLALVK